MKLPHTSLEAKHLPVMIDEVLQVCNPKNGGNYLDCTFGGGGYSKEILKEILNSNNEITPHITGSKTSSSDDI